MHWILYFSNLLNLYPLAKHIASHVIQVSVVGWSMGSQYQGWITRERFKKFFHFIEERRVWISRPQINEFTGNVGWFSNRFLLLIPNYIKSWIKLKIVQNHINVLLTMSPIHIMRGMSIMYHVKYHTNINKNNISWFIAWLINCISQHDDVIKWKHFPRYWPFVQGIHLTPGNSLHRGQWRGSLMFSLTCAWTNGWVNNQYAGDLIRHRAHYDVTVMNATCPIVPTDNYSGLSINDLALYF